MAKKVVAAAAENAAKRKTRCWGKICSQRGVSFVPAALESTGLIHDELFLLIKTLGAHFDLQWEVDYGTGELVAQILAALVEGNAAMSVSYTHLTLPTNREV